jgi:hypothetical protein
MLPGNIHATTRPSRRVMREIKENARSPADLRDCRREGARQMRSADLVDLVPMEAGRRDCDACSSQ